MTKSEQEIISAYRAVKAMPTPANSQPPAAGQAAHTPAHIFDVKSAFDALPVIASDYRDEHERPEDGRKARCEFGAVCLEESARIIGNSHTALVAALETAIAYHRQSPHYEQWTAALASARQ